MHSRDRRDFGRRKMRIRNKWEVVLVLTVIAAGIVITTVAAIKAKERRRNQTENKSVNNTIKSSVSQVRESANNRSGGQSSESSVTRINRRRFPFEKRPKYDDYDVEYDLIKSGADEYTALASEPMNDMPRHTRLRVLHDGLPGFPPPFGITGDFNTNVELSADGAGFLLDSTYPFIDQIDGKKEEVMQKSANTNSDIVSNVRTNANKVKTSLKLNFNNNDDNKLANNEPKRTPVFVEPPKQASEPKLKAVHMKASERKPDVNIAIPVKIVPRIPMANFSPENSGPIRLSLPALEPAIRFLGLSDDFRHSNDYGLAQGGQAAIGNVPMHMRRFISSEITKPENTMHSMNGNQSPKQRSKRESERRFVLKQFNAKQIHSSAEDLSESEPKTGESRYIPFNERSYISNSREDSQREHSTHESDVEKIRPIFNFDDSEKRFPPVVSTSREHNHNDDKYPSVESRGQHKYGLLGSGNFEIIKGGYYADEESASNTVPNYAHESDNNSNRKSDRQAPTHYPTVAERNRNNDDEGELNGRFEPFNLDFFTNSPILGFQGFDNFGASHIDKYKTPVPVRNVMKMGAQRGQRRHVYDAHPDGSNLHIIASDEDLIFDS